MKSSLKRFAVCSILLLYSLNVGCSQEPGSPGVANEVI